MPDTTSVPTTRRPRGSSAVRGFFQSFFWNFWIKRIILYRVVSIVALVFAIFNVWGYSFWAWMVEEFSSGAIWSLSSGGDRQFESAMFVLASVFVILASIYVLRKAWQGIGSRLLWAVLIGGATGVVVWALTLIHVIPSSGNGFIVAVQAMGGVVIGICFSMTLIDRQLSGTLTTHTPDDDDHHHGDDGP